MKRWFAVWTKPRQEGRAEQNLRQQGFEVLCPMAKERKRLGGRVQWIVAPMFPRYLFVRADTALQSMAPIRSSKGCVDVVRVAGEPAAIPSRVVQALGCSPEPVLIDAAWQKGQQLEVVDGPLSGASVFFEAKSGKERVEVLLMMLGQWRSIILADSDLAAAS